MNHSIKIPGSISRLARLLSDDTPTVQDGIRRRVLQAILLLSAMLDLLFLVWILPSVHGISSASFQHPEWWTSIASLLACLTLFRMTQRGRVQLAAKLFVVFAFLATWALLYGMLAATQDVREVSRVLAILILSQMFCGLLLDFRSNLGFAVANLCCLATLPMIFSEIPTAQVVGVSVMFAFSILLSALTGLLHHLDLTEIVISRRCLEENVVELRGQILAREEAERTNSELKEALERTQRREALARMAGGFAHDFNNALMGVLGQLERARPGSSSQQLARIDEAIHSVERASGLVKGMLTITHPGDKAAQCQPSDLAHLLREAHSLARGALHDGIQIETDAQDGIWALADEGSIVQVVLNLCVNARDAIDAQPDQAGSGRIRLSNGRLAPNDPLARTLGESPDGYAWIQVEDDGPGILPEAREKIFDPFFTTKGVGKGTGLGLWMCDALARGMGGQILSAAREDGARGASLRIYLPACEPGSQTSVWPADGPGTEGSQLSGRILIVDDDDAVRENMATVLSEAGWDVLQSFDGIDALKRFEAGPDNFRLMILDLSLPGLPGRDVFAKVRSIRPEFPVLVISGYDINAGEAAPTVEGANGRLLKPFRTKSLLKEIDRIAPST